MKKTIIALSLSALVFFPLMFALPRSAEALALAKFPDPRNNQPLPAEAHPNISHSVQANDPIAPGMEIEPDKPATDIVTNAPVETETRSSHRVWWVVGILGIALIGYGVIRSKKETF